MKNTIRKIVLRMFPELDSGTHLPQLAVVTGIPDPPKSGEVCDEFQPRYAVDVRLLHPSGRIDEDMPLIRDVPVAMCAAAPDRGFAALPQPGTVVEIAFAFGMQTKPFIRSILPYNLKLPAIDAESQRWQQSATSFQEVDRTGNWRRQTAGEIVDQASKIWIGNQADNTLVLDSSFMGAVISALNTLASHTHPDVGACSQGGEVSAQSNVIGGLKQKLDLITKT